MDSTHPDRPGDWRLLIPALCFGAAMFGARFLLAAPGLTRRTAVLVALLPLLPFLWFVLWAVRAVERLDELHRLVHLRALAFAFPATGGLLVGLLLLDQALSLRPGEFGFRHVPLAMAAFYFVGLWLARRAYA